MPTTEPSAKKRRALSPSHSADAKKADPGDRSLSDVDNITLPIEFLKELSSSLNVATNGFMNLPSSDPAARGRFVAILSQVQKKIDAKLGVTKRVSLYPLYLGESEGQKCWHNSAN